MLRRIHSRRPNERGQVLVITALLATALLGFAGLLVDAGLLAAQRRQAQNAADESALAAARILFQGSTISSAETAALEYADANGFDNATQNAVEINVPPLSGDHQGDPNYAEVIVEEHPDSFFIHTILPGDLTVRARGVAGFELFPEPYALVVLSEHDCKAFDQGGNASLAIDGGGVMVNSDCASNALSKIGTGGITASGSIDIHGGYSIVGSGPVSPEPKTVPWTVSNPLATMSPPLLGAPAPGSPGTAASPKTWTYTSGGNITLSPGTYYGGFSANCACTITLQPGIYIMAGGGFTKGGGTNFVGDGVMIYVTTNPANPTGDGAAKPFTLTGTGVLDLSPPTSGLYEGITLWQDAAITADLVMRGSNDMLSGILYAPGSTLDIAGDSQLGTVQLVVDGFLLTGNAPLNLTYGEFRTFEAPEVVLVE